MIYVNKQTNLATYFNNIRGWHWFFNVSTTRNCTKNGTQCRNTEN